MGVQVHKVVQTGTISTGGVDLSRNEVTRYQMRLRVSPQLKASFRKESWGDALVKVFKKELQTGDAEFDKLVYISTDTPERTSAFLTPEMRQAIAFAVDMRSIVTATPCSPRSFDSVVGAAVALAVALAVVTTAVDSGVGAFVSPCAETTSVWDPSLSAGPDAQPNETHPSKHQERDVSWLLRD